MEISGRVFLSNNQGALRELAEALCTCDCSKFLMSSTRAIYPAIAMIDSKSGNILADLPENSSISSSALSSRNNARGQRVFLELGDTAPVDVSRPIHRDEQTVSSEINRL